MKKRMATGIHWPQNFAWRVGENYKAPVRFASQVIRYEQEVLGNEMGVPDFLLDEMDRADIRPHDLLWVCLTKEAALNFARQGDGEPYKVYVGKDALVLCKDGEDGYLLLFEPSRLSPAILQRFEHYRAETIGQPVENDHTIG